MLSGRVCGVFRKGGRGVFGWIAGGPDEKCAVKATVMEGVNCFVLIALIKRHSVFVVAFNRIKCYDIA